MAENSIRRCPKCDCLTDMPGECIQCLAWADFGEFEACLEELNDDERPDAFACAELYSQWGGGASSGLADGREWQFPAHVREAAKGTVPA